MFLKYVMVVGNEELVFNGQRVSTEGDEKVLEMVVGMVLQ